MLDHACLNHFSRTHHANQRAIEVRGVLRTLPDGLAEHQVKVGGEVDRVVEYLGRRVVALRDGRVVRETVLARRVAVRAQRAFLRLAVGVTKGLEYAEKKRAAKIQAEAKGGTTASSAERSHGARMYAGARCILRPQKKSRGKPVHGRLGKTGLLKPDFPPLVDIFWPVCTTSKHHPPFATTDSRHHNG